MYEIEICEKCNYGGEPNGCNSPEGECQEYEKISDLIEKNTPVKMYQPIPRIYKCPECREGLNPMWDYCPWCGQRVED